MTVSISRRESLLEKLYSTWKKNRFLYPAYFKTSRSKRLRSQAGIWWCQCSAVRGNVGRSGMWRSSEDAICLADLLMFSSCRRLKHSLLQSPESFSIINHVKTDSRNCCTFFSTITRSHLLVNELWLYFDFTVVHIMYAYNALYIFIENLEEI